jgi:hypothetical protein
MAKSPLPHGFVLGFGYAIPFLEALLGLTLILGAELGPRDISPTSSCASAR